jgi:hypothetical protein
MTIFDHAYSVPTRWLAFDLSVLRRLKFKSIAIPFAGEPDLGVHLKRWGVCVATSDAAQWAWIRSIARIENNTDQLTEEELNIVLEDAYVPGYKLRNPALRHWFTETDSWWFDNVRENAEKLNNLIKRAIALSIGIGVGDYVRSFDEETREYRQPLSKVFRKIWESEVAPFNNGLNNTSDNLEAKEFVADQRTDLLFLRLPRPGSQHIQRNAPSAWREEWIRGESDFWSRSGKIRAGRLGAAVQTSQQYLRLIEDLLETAAHIPVWAISFVENQFIPTEELVETVSRIRKIETIYTKDFSALTGVRASIITAS